MSKKRKKVTPVRRGTAINTERLARDLVKRGLASPEILSSAYNPTQKGEAR